MCVTGVSNGLSEIDLAAGIEIEFTEFRDQHRLVAGVAKGAARPGIDRYTVETLLGKEGQQVTLAVIGVGFSPVIIKRAVVIKIIGELSTQLITGGIIGIGFALQKINP